MLAGRDDEFIAIVLMGFTGMRWGELVGLETRYVRSTGVRVEWQLYELDTGETVNCPECSVELKVIATSPIAVGLVDEEE